MPDREATTRFVILGLLSRAGPLTGYGIRQWIRQTIGFFWAESFGQLYPTLDHLARGRYVAVTRQTAASSRRQRLYRITPSGRRQLTRWLEKPSRPERPRVEHLLKLFFGREVSVETNRQHVQRVAERYASAKESFTQAEHLLLRTARESGNDTEDLVYWLITLRSGLLLSAARERWAADSLMLLEAYRIGGVASAVKHYKSLGPP